MRILTIISFLLMLSFLGYAQSEDTLDMTPWQFVQIDPMKNFNSSALSFSPCYFEDGIVFVTTREKDGAIDRKIREPFFDLKFASLDESGFPSGTPEDLGLNTGMHEGPSSYNAATGRLFYTSNVSSDEHADSWQLGIFSAMKVDGAWTDVQEFRFNLPNYTVCHPSLTADGKTLYFASNMPGGYGGMDLYVCERFGVQWTTPKNLGPNINSSEHDCFPFIHPSGNLFFASQGHQGMGNYDLFISYWDESQWKQATNLGAPLNSTGDDLGLILDANGLTGFYTSNRKGGAGKDDIFKLNSNNPLTGPAAIETINAELFVLDMLTFKPIQDAELNFVPVGPNGEVDKERYNNPELWKSNESGRVYLNLIPNQQYLFSVIKNGYIAHEEILVANTLISIGLEPRKNDITKPSIPIVKNTAKKITLKNTELKKGAVVVLDGIYYNYNESKIKQDAAKDLDQLASVLFAHPDLVIELSSHTDSRGDAMYNQILSIERADAAKAYLVAKGIQGHRVLTVGHGESKIRNQCKNGVKCSEDEHQFNRRTEVKVLSTASRVEIRSE